MPDSLKTLKSNLDQLINAARDQASGTGLPPVHAWSPDLSGHMDMTIRRDGSWWHEGGEIKRPGLVRLFASILRKDADGHTYLVSPVEKWRITVEAGHFLAIRLDVQGEGQDQRLFFTTNMDEVVEIGADHPVIMRGGEPYLGVRGNLEALLTRSVFFDLADYVAEHEGKTGVWAAGMFFPLDAA